MRVDGFSTSTRTNCPQQEIFSHQYFRSILPDRGAHAAIDDSQLSILSVFSPLVVGKSERCMALNRESTPTVTVAYILPTVKSYFRAYFRARWSEAEQAVGQWSAAGDQKTQLTSGTSSSLTTREGLLSLLPSIRNAIGRVHK